MLHKKQTEQSKLPIFERGKWILVFFLVAAGCWANHRYSYIDWPLRFSAWILLLCVIAWLVVLTTQGHRFVGFSKDVRLELRKVVWPSRKETVQTTILVVCMVVFVAIVLWGLDTFLFWGVSLLMGQRNS